ncbi:bifunctional diaminohydroxyphosphoribosylaminopyrimidine deaminase/5-amino-6-(5-phosphoribosylamino)uracil reductase [Citrobacter koseri]|uniref:Bifunctional diaminohydroxyphosphoribosylaminopyrimidine deaminase/5-amino-6-(5-phosphoribosylamino)uracil reductase n=1 Tax=Citrobacter koseri TaxID=545 RepID=A0A2X2V985_CITKO|nr:bifunctional diaminohydroxyphosphoribosylaminopyrimidine deaminase/5-amino-6-(5-phosphoribosylamino)uracil reductase [Citrobacter koseri]
MLDEFYMARALKLAQRGRFTTHPNPNVGCVIGQRWRNRWRRLPSSRG